MTTETPSSHDFIKWGLWALGICGAFFAVGGLLSYPDMVPFVRLVAEGGALISGVATLGLLATGVFARQVEREINRRLGGK